MSGFRLMDYNYAFDPKTGLSASSSDSEFPVTNLRRFFRSKVWRSAGFFRFTTAKYLDFKESAMGSELSAVVAVGDYTRAELAAAIKAALELAGADTYTVTFDEDTGKWTIASNGSYLALLQNTGTNVANSIWSAIGFAVDADSSGALTYTGPKIAIHTVERIVFDLRSIESIDSVAVLFNPQRGEGVKLSSSAVLKLKLNALDLWESPAVEQTLSIDYIYDIATHFFSANQNYRFVCIEITDPQNANLYVEISKVIISKATQFSQQPEMGFRDRVLDMSRATETAYGHRYSDIYPNRRTLDFNYAVMTESDCETMQKIYARVGSTVPVCAVLDPEAALFDKDRFFLYGYFPQRQDVGHRALTYFDLPLGIEEAM